MRIVLAFSILLSPYALAADQPAGKPSLDPNDSAMRPYLEMYSANRAALERRYSVEDSPIRRARMQEFNRQWLQTIEAVDFQGLNETGRIDWILFRNKLEHDQRELDIRAKAAQEIAPLLPFSATIIGLEDARLSMTPLEPAKAAATLDEIRRQVETVTKSLEAQVKEGAPAIKKTSAHRAAQSVQGLKKTLQHWFTFYNGYDPVFTWWASEPYQAASKALDGYSSFLKEKVVGLKPDDKTTIVGKPVGREALLNELAFEMIPYSPEQLLQIAEKEFAWCEAQMVLASRQMGFGDNWKQALEKVKTMHVEPGQQPEMIRALAVEAEQFVEKNKLVTVPPLANEIWRIEMMTPERQLVNPFFLGGEVIIVSYPTNTMTQEQKLMSMRGNNRYFARATVHHEVIPGHHLQLYMSDRYRTWRYPFSTPFAVEGWALYWEMLLWDLGFPLTPEDRVGMLFWRMHRCARIIFSLSFHLEKMTPQESIDFLVNRVGHERENAAAEVRRSFEDDSYGPLYQIAYMIGGLQFRSLHQQLVGSGKMTNQEFHDRLLRENLIPVEMMRADLIGQQLSRDFRSSWKFYGQLPE